MTKPNQLITQARRHVLRARTQEERFKWLVVQAVAEGRLATARQGELKRAA